MGGAKQGGDDAPLRPRLRVADAARAPHPELAGWIARLAAIRREHRALRHGVYRPLHVASEQLAFARTLQDETVVVAVNAAAAPAGFEVQVSAPEGATFVDLLDPERRFPARAGRLRIDDVPPRGARILVLR
jgi:glycosidase